jgi:hypothetical protein
VDKFIERLIFDALLFHSSVRLKIEQNQLAFGGWCNGSGDIGVGTDEFLNHPTDFH